MPQSDMTIRVLALSLYGPLAASTRYRLLQYAPGLAAAGIDLTCQWLLPNAYVERTYAGLKYSRALLLHDYCRRLSVLARQRSHDIVILNAELFPLVPGVLERKLLRIPYIYDFDDAFFLKYRLPRFQHVAPLLKTKFEPIIAGAAAVLAGNTYLASYARIHNSSTEELPTVVDTARYRRRTPRYHSTFTIGWVGSPSTSIYLSEMIPAIRLLGTEGSVRVIAVGGRCPDIHGVEVVNRPWSEEAEVEDINGFDVGVMPLFDDEWGGSHRHQRVRCWRDASV
jgi:hypothetical protein